MKPYDPNKDVYQLDWGMPPPGNMTFFGKMSVRELNATDDQLRISEMKRGSDMMFYGVLLAVVCAIVHIMSTTTTNPLAKVASRFMEWGIVLGVALIAVGLIYKKVTQYENWIILGMVVVGGGALLYWKRDWSISHFFKKNKTPKKEIS